MVIKNYFYLFKHEMILLFFFLNKIVLFFFFKQNSPLEIPNNLGGDVGIEKRRDINVTSLMKLDDGYIEIHYTGFLSSR